MKRWEMVDDLRRAFMSSRGMTTWRTPRRLLGKTDPWFQPDLRGRGVWWEYLTGPALVDCSFLGLRFRNGRLTGRGTDGDSALRGPKPRGGRGKDLLAARGLPTRRRLLREKPLGNASGQNPASAWQGRREDARAPDRLVLVADESTIDAANQRALSVASTSRLTERIFAVAERDPTGAQPEQSHGLGNEST